MTLATVGLDGRPWCAHLFYTWMEGDNGGAFVFTTDPSTRHGAEMTLAGDGAEVAAAIALETRVVGRVRGLQIEGVAACLRGDAVDPAHRAYLRRFPYAATMNTTLWTLSPTTMKLTDNTLGFGKKLIWEKPGAF